MKYFNILRYDFKNGYCTKPSKWCAIVLLYAFMFVSFTFTMFHGFYFEVKGINDINSLGLSFGDVLMYCIGGTVPTVQLSTQNFSFPTLWFLSHILICYITLDYLNKDLFDSGVQVITRVKNKALWWLSKCAWNVVTVMTCYFAGYGVLYLLSTLTAKLNSFNLNPTIFNFLYAQSIPQINTPGIELFFAMCVLPCAVGVTVNLIQMTLTLFIKPIFAFTAVAIYFIVGIFYVHPIMLTNFAMPVRSAAIGFYNFTITGAVVTCIIFSAVAVLVGAIKINKKDIINTTL